MQIFNSNYDAKEELAALPRDYTVEMALKNNDILFTPKRESYNTNRLRLFSNNIKDGIPDKIRITEFGFAGPPCIAILEYNGELVKYTLDCTRLYGSTAIQSFNGSDVVEKLEKRRNGIYVHQFYLDRLQKGLHPIFSEIADIEYSAKEELATLPKDYTVGFALANDDVLLTPQLKAYNVDKLIKYIYNVNNGIPDKIRITKFGFDSPPSISILEYNGKNIKYTVDETRIMGPTAIYVFNGDNMNERFEKTESGHMVHEFYLNSYERGPIPVFVYV